MKVRELLDVLEMGLFRGVELTESLMETGRNAIKLVDTKSIRIDEFGLRSRNYGYHESGVYVFLDIFERRLKSFGGGKENYLEMKKDTDLMESEVIRFDVLMGQTLYKCSSGWYNSDNSELHIYLK